MTVYKRPDWKTFRYDFVFQGKRYSGNTHQLTKADAQLVERELQLKLRHQAGNIAQFFPNETPRFSDWAEVFLAYKEKRIDRPDHVRWVTGVLLRFFGGLPKGKTRTDLEPYHDLRLGAVIADPDWILKFEEWMTRRQIGAQSRNHYRSMMRRMYALAMQPEYRKATGVAMNPFVGVQHEPTMERTTVLTPDQVRAWLSHASYHVRLAVAIAALAPKLRLANVLALEWGHIEPDPRASKFDRRLAYYIVVRKHKTARKTGRPLVSPVSTQLFNILRDAYKRNPTSPYVVTYRGGPVKSIRDGVRAAAEDAGLTYGRDVEDGATFHTLRHTATTILSAGEADPLKVRDAIGHADLATTMKYRHMRPQQERPTIERLSKQMKIADVVTAPRRRAVRVKR